MKYYFSLLILLVNSSACFAINTSNLQNKIQFNNNNFSTLNESKVWSGHATPSQTLPPKILDMLQKYNYKKQDGNDGVVLNAKVIRFEWGVFFGVVDVELTIQYSLTGNGVVESKTISSKASATRSEAGWTMDGSYRTAALAMDRLTDDSVNKLQAFLSTVIVKEQLKVEPIQKPTESNQLLKQGELKSSGDSLNADNQILERPLPVDRLSIEASKKKCTELGFKPATEGHGKCVLQLSK